MEGMFCKATTDQAPLKSAYDTYMNLNFKTKEGVAFDISTNNLHDFDLMMKFDKE